jgi:RNA polymerase sigma-70 factor (ECF subfamily)
MQKRRRAEARLLFFSNMNEAEIIKACIKGERRAQNALYKLYFPLMSSICLRYTKDKDEAIQKLNTGFFKILKNISNYNSEFAFATFVRTIMVNHLIDEFRKEKQYQSTFEFKDYNELEQEVSYNQAELDFNANDLLNLLKTLPEVSQKVFNLFAMDGYKHQEIAELLNISAGTSKWHVSDARKKLKDLLDKQKKRTEIA